jgi:hypothetical protein
MPQRPRRPEPPSKARSSALALLLTPLLLPTASPAQQPDAAGFDLDRVLVIDRYEPFYATETHALRDVLDEGILNDETPLLVMEHPSGVLAFVMDQMAYHHLAQGDIDGEPWMVSF